MKTGQRVCTVNAIKLTKCKTIVLKTGQELRKLICLIVNVQEWISAFDERSDLRSPPRTPAGLPQPSGSWRVENTDAAASEGHQRPDKDRVHLNNKDVASPPGSWGRLSAAGRSHSQGSAKGRCELIGGRATPTFNNPSIFNPYILPADTVIIER